MKTKKDNQAKIVATIGPAPEKKETLEAMIKSGMDIARLNFSHGNHDWHHQAIINLRHAAYKIGKPVGIMADLQGPRVRIAEFISNEKKIKELEFKKGERVILAEKSYFEEKKKIKKNLIVLDCEDPLVKFLSKNDPVFLDNGMVELKSKKNLGNGGFEMLVKNPGTIKARKGINFPTLAKHIPAFTSKDIKDLEFVLKQGLDFVALSFVKRADDILNLRKKIVKIIGKNARQPWIIAKIETVEALHNIKGLLEVVDGIMVARGDLGVEAPPEKVPVYQKLLIRHCFKAGVPVIVATNMLESMTTSPRPTRAELLDVANAVIDRADAVMLSGESASGKYPILSVGMMEKIIRSTEKSPYDDLNRIKELDKRRNEPPKNLYEMTVQSVYKLALEPCGAIVLDKVPLFFIKHLVSLRPKAPIVCFLGSHNPLSRKVLLCWGVLPFLEKSDFNKALSKLKSYILVTSEKRGKNWQFKVKIEHPQTGGRK